MIKKHILLLLTQRKSILNYFKLQFKALSEMPIAQDASKQQLNKVHVDAPIFSPRYSPSSRHIEKICRKCY